MKELALSLPGIGGYITVPQGIPHQVPYLGQNIIQVAITSVFIIVIIMTLGYLLYGGFLWIFAAGDRQKMERARKTITYAVLGMSVSFLAFLFVNVLLYFFGLPNVAH